MADGFMTDGSGSNSRDVVALGMSSSGGAARKEAGSSSWRDDARRSANARFGAVRDFVRDRRWAVVAAAAVLALSGAGLAAGVGASSERADALEKTVAERERQVADLDAARKRHEDRLAELQKQINAKESQIAETEERTAALEKRREGLQRQVAELVAPVAPGATERVADGSTKPHGPDVAASSADVADVPPDETADAGPSTAQVDEDARTAAVEPRREPRAERIRAASRVDDAAGGVSLDDRSAAAPVRVFIHVRAADRAARERAAAVAAELRRRGVASVEIRGVRLPVARDAVRFFYDEDRGAIPELQDAVRSASPSGRAPVVNDFRSFGAPPRRGTIELWLS